MVISCIQEHEMTSSL